MTKRVFRPMVGSILGAAAATVALLSVPTASGQMKQKQAKVLVKGPTPRLANGKPDFAGVWQPPRMADVTKDEACCKGVKDLPFTDWGKQQWDNYDAAKADYAGSCLPFGLLRSVGGPHPVQIIQNDKYISMMWEQNSWFHITPIDGRPHTKNPEPTWFGESVGRWEDDTLVIDTIGFNGMTKVDTIGHPVSDQLHTVERFRRPELGKIEYTITIEDPKTYTKPWVSERIWILHPEWEIMEYSCEENNKDLWEGRLRPPALKPQ